jgi:hypothetical protein
MAKTPHARSSMARDFIDKELDRLTKQMQGYEALVPKH